MKQLFDKKVIRAVFPKTIPVLTGYLVLGFGFGLLLQSKGYNFIWAFCMSLTIYAGSMQYVAIDLMSSGATLLSAGFMTLMINARHLFYGISMLIKYRDLKKVKPYVIFGLTDETYSLLCSSDVPEGLDKEAYYFWTTAFDQSYWIIGSTLGALFGQAVNINTKGVDFAMTALFIVIFTDNLLKKESRLPALLGMSISFVCLILFGPSDFLIPSMLMIAAALMLLRPLLSKNLPQGKQSLYEVDKKDENNTQDKNHDEYGENNQEKKHRIHDVNGENGRVQQMNHSLNRNKDKKMQKQADCEINAKQELNPNREEQSNE